MICCEYCGKEFKNKKALSGHLSSCVKYYLSKDGDLDKYTARIEKIKKSNTKYDIIDKDAWLLEKHRCECCGRIMTEYFGSGRFCSKKCSNTRNHSDDVKQKIKLSCTSRSKDLYDANPKYCAVCHNKIPYEMRRRKTCSDVCNRILCRPYRLKGGHIGGRRSAASQQKRSKHEIEFCNKCEEYFGKENVLHNVPIFNGWDADIILPQYKLAILWNGPWHYYKVTKYHKLEQVQNRDRLKIQEIRDSGYTEYIIKDVNSSKDIVDKEFDKLLNFLNIKN